MKDRFTTILDLSSFKKQDKSLFDIQPCECRKPLDLSNKDLFNWSKIPKRVFFFDPTKLYERINEEKMLNSYQRHCSVSMTFLFKNKENICACGCGKQLTGKKKDGLQKIVVILHSQYFQ